MGLSISKRCLQSYPCQHTVTIKGKKIIMFGNEIYSYCVDNHIRVPQHFKEYKKYIEEQNIIKAIHSNDIKYVKDVVDENVNCMMNLYSQRSQSCVFTIEACKGSLDILKLLHEKYAVPINNNCLIEATKIGNAEMVVYILKRAKDKNIEDKITPMIPENCGRVYNKYSDTAYSMAASTFNLPLMMYFETKSELTKKVALHTLSRIEKITDASIIPIKEYLLNKIDDFNYIEKEQRISNLKDLIEKGELTEQMCHKMLSNINEICVEEYDMIWEHLTFLKNNGQ